MKILRSCFILFILTSLTTSFVRPDDWVVLEDSHFKILFPKKPTDQTQTVDSPVGKLTIQIHMYEAPETDDNHTYGLMTSEYPDSTVNSDQKELVDNFFSGAIEGAVNNVKGKLLSVDTVQIAGYPGRHFRVDYQEGLAVITMRAYLVKNKMYMIQTITDTKKDHNKAMERFMSSFELKH